METCEQCGNHEQKCFVVEMDGRRHLFDSFECAITALAPLCGHCRCRILGHGVSDAQGRHFCCRHCATQHANYLCGRSEGA